jgi:hypothetical protein
MAVLYHMKHYIFDVINLQNGFASLQFEFARAVVPTLVPLCLTFMKRLLPNKLYRPISERTVLALTEQATLASELVEALRSLGYLSGGLEAEVEQLSHFAANPGRHFLRALTTSARTRCRDLLLKEKSKGWEGVGIEVEVSILMPAVPEMQTSLPQPPVDSTQQIGKGRADEDVWATWDEVESAPTSGEPIRSFASPESNNRTLSPKVTPTKLQPRQKKSALGGVRVVKPQDQLGSGPMPEDDEDWGWGVDEEAPAPSVAQSAQKAAGVAQSAADEDDWFAQELRVASPPPSIKATPVAKTGVKLTRTSTMGSDRSATGTSRVRIIGSPQRSGTTSPRPLRSNKVAARTIHSPRNVVSPIASDGPSLTDLVADRPAPSYSHSETVSSGHSHSKVVSPPPSEAPSVGIEETEISDTRNLSLEPATSERWDTDSERLDEGDQSKQADESNLLDTHDVPTPLGKAGDLITSLATKPMEMIEQILPLDEEPAHRYAGTRKQDDRLANKGDEGPSLLAEESTRNPTDAATPLGKAGDFITSMARKPMEAIEDLLQADEGPAQIEPTVEEEPEEEAWDWDGDAEEEVNEATAKENVEVDSKKAVSVPQDVDMLRSSSSNTEADASAAASFTRSRLSIDLANFSTVDSVPETARLVDESASDAGERSAPRQDDEQTPMPPHDEQFNAPDLSKYTVSDLGDDHWATKEEALEHNEVLSGSDGVAPSVSVGKSSGSGEKLSDVPTESWEELSTSNIRQSEVGAIASVQQAERPPLDTPVAVQLQPSSSDGVDADEQDFFKQHVETNSLEQGDDGEAWGWNDDDEVEDEQHIPIQSGAVNSLEGDSSPAAVLPATLVSESATTASIEEPQELTEAIPVHTTTEQHHSTQPDHVNDENHYEQEREANLTKMDEDGEAWGWDDNEEAEEDLLNKSSHSLPRQADDNEPVLSDPDVGSVPQAHEESKISPLAAVENREASHEGFEPSDAHEAREEQHPLVQHAEMVDKTDIESDQQLAGAEITEQPVVAASLSDFKPDIISTAAYSVEDVAGLDPMQSLMADTAAQETHHSDTLDGEHDDEDLPEQSHATEGGQEGDAWGWNDEDDIEDNRRIATDSNEEDQPARGDAIDEAAPATSKATEVAGLAINERHAELDEDLFEPLDTPIDPSQKPSTQRDSTDAEQYHTTDLTEGGATQQSEKLDEGLFEPFDTAPTGQPEEDHGDGFFEQSEILDSTKESQDADVWGWNDEEDAENDHQTTFTPSQSRAVLPEHHGNPVPGATADVKSTTTQTPVLTAPLIQEPIKRMEKCLISQRSVDFVELLDELMDDMEAILEEGQTSQAAGLEITQLAECFDDLIDLHTALMPVGHADTLDNVPTLAAQFFNDCTYITRELLRLDAGWRNLADRFDGVLDLDRVKLAVEKQAQATALLGQRSFDAQIIAQQQLLEECLDQTHSFEATYDEARFHQCQRAMRQIVVVMQQLSKAWKPVLTTSNHQMACGRLIDVILQRVLRDVIALNDISEVEGEKLSELLRSLNELEVLFRTSSEPSPQEGELSDVALHVPSWFKASYLSDILTGSLVDIEFLYFEAGALIDYSKEELTGLLRALFSDSPKRNRLIERIQAATI